MPTANELAIVAAVAADPGHRWAGICAAPSDVVPSPADDSFFSEIFAAEDAASAIAEAAAASAVVVAPAANRIQLEDSEDSTQDEDPEDLPTEDLEGY
jgi:hypothetical protein